MICHETFWRWGLRKEGHYKTLPPVIFPADANSSDQSNRSSEMSFTTLIQATANSATNNEYSRARIQRCKKKKRANANANISFCSTSIESNFQETTHRKPQIQLPSTKKKVQFRTCRDDWLAFKPFLRPPSPPHCNLQTSTMTAYFPVRAKKASSSWASGPNWT